MLNRFLIIVPPPASVLQPKHGGDVRQHPEQAAAAEAQHFQRGEASAGGPAAEGPDQEAGLRGGLRKCRPPWERPEARLCGVIVPYLCLVFFLQIEIKNHVFFSPINWDDLNAKKITPPFNPNVVCFHLNVDGSSVSMLFFLYRSALNKRILVSPPDGTERPEAFRPGVHRRAGTQLHRLFPRQRPGHGQYQGGFRGLRGLLLRPLYGLLPIGLKQIH